MTYVTKQFTVMARINGRIYAQQVRGRGRGDAVCAAVFFEQPEWVEAYEWALCDYQRIGTKVNKGLPERKRERVI